DLHRRDLDQPEQVALAVPTGPDDADAKRLVDEIGGVRPGGGQRQPGRAGDHEVAAVHRLVSPSQGGSEGSRRAVRRRGKGTLREPQTVEQSSAAEATPRTAATRTSETKWTPT